MSAFICRTFWKFHFSWAKFRTGFTITRTLCITSDIVTKIVGRVRSVLWMLLNILFMMTLSSFTMQWKIDVTRPTDILHCPSLHITLFVRYQNTAEDILGKPRSETFKAISRKRCRGWTSWKSYLQIDCYLRRRGISSYIILDFRPVCRFPKPEFSEIGFICIDFCNTKRADPS